jgi:hypothetical protein
LYPPDGIFQSNGEVRYVLKIKKKSQMQATVQLQCAHAHHAMFSNSFIAAKVQLSVYARPKAAIKRGKQRDKSAAQDVCPKLLATCKRLPA